MTILIIASYAPSILNFRKDLILSFKKKARVIVLAPFEDEQTEFKITELGVEFLSIPMRSQGLNPIDDLKLALFLFMQFKKIKPTMIFSYTAKPVIWSGIAAKFAGVTNICSLITGLGFGFTEVLSRKHKFLNLLLRSLYKKALKNNKTIFFQNPDDLNLFKERNIIANTKKVIVVNGSGVDLNYFSFQKEFVLSPIKFLLIARLIEDKGICEYIEAAKIIKAKYDNAEFHLVGYLDNNPRCLKQDVLDKAIKDSVIIFHGKLDDVREIIKSCSVYVLPSYREGTPRSVLEAMAIGRAIITTDAPGCRETVIEGKNGFLVPIKNVQKLAEAMEHFIKEPDLIEKMGGASRCLAEEKYDVHKVNEKMLKTMGV